MTPELPALLVDRQPRIPERDQVVREELLLHRLYRKPKAPRNRA